MPTETLPCTPTALMAHSACFNCLSQSEKQLAVLYLMGSIAADFSEDLRLSDPTQSRKLFACLTCEPESVLDSFLISVWMDFAVGLGVIPARMTIAALRKAIRCFECGIGPKEIKAAQVYLLCKLFTAIEEEEQSPCWVAQEVYGLADPRWRIFRRWLMGPAPGWLRAIYTGYGRGFAKWIADKPRVKRVVRYFMDKVVNRNR